jgi:hypothetical protein
MKVKGEKKLRCERARRFGRGLASVLGSWEVVKAEVSLAQINPSSQVDLPQEAETKRVPGKSECLPQFRSFTPSLPACSIGPIVCSTFHF